MPNLARLVFVAPVIQLPFSQLSHGLAFKLLSHFRPSRRGDFSRPFFAKFRDPLKIYWIGQLADPPKPSLSADRGAPTASQLSHRINPYVRIMKLLLPGKFFQEGKSLKYSRPESSLGEIFFHFAEEIFVSGKFHSVFSFLAESWLIGDLISFFLSRMNFFHFSHRKLQWFIFWDWISRRWKCKFK